MSSCEAPAQSDPGPTSTTFQVTGIWNANRVEDEAELVRGPGEPPEPIAARAMLREGETLITGVGVTAQVAVEGRTVQGQFVRLDEQTSFEVLSTDPDAPRIRVLKGRLWFTSALSVQRLGIEVGQAARIQPLGTEYALEVRDLERGTGFKLLLIDGQAQVSIGGTEPPPLGTMWEGEWHPVTGWSPHPLDAADPQAAIQAVNQRIQWALYYPAVLDPSELPVDLELDAALEPSVAAYRRGNLLQALKVYPRLPPTRPGTEEQPVVLEAAAEDEVATEGIGGWAFQPAENEAERLYQVALLLSFGRVEVAETMLGPPPEAISSDPADEVRLAQALRVLIAAARGEDIERRWEPKLATEWMAESYYQQSRANRAETGPELPWERELYGRRSPALARARLAAREALRVGGASFSFAGVRVAELEFSFEDRRKAEAAIHPALASGPENAQAWALKGFILAGQGRISTATNVFAVVAPVDAAGIRNAMDAFNRAIALDSRLGNGWLGRGLSRIHEGEFRAGLRDLQRAVAAEPNRSFLRSYLGKAYDQAAREIGRVWSAAGRDLKRELARPEGESRTEFLDRKAADQLAVAQRLDPGDPTAPLYSALLKQSQNRINEAVAELELSKEQNRNRMLFRSRALLDQDQAVRSANLAAIYRDAGMADVSVREATRAVTSDYANYAAHLFLASSYDALRDPLQINLRYETAWLNELLLAQLLQPVGAGALSQTVSQHEYSRLFEQDHLGLFSSTEYTSDGDWKQSASQYGTIGRTGYAVDVFYYNSNGDRPNNDYEEVTVWGKLKQQLTPDDSVLVLASYLDRSSGDTRPLYDPTNARPTWRAVENQEPILLAGYHRRWSPSQQTLVLGGWLNDTLEVADAPPDYSHHSLLGRLLGAPDTDEIRYWRDLAYESELNFATAEVQHLANVGWSTTIAGARYQAGQLLTSSLETDPSLDYGLEAPDPLGQQEVTADFNRASVYAYEYAEVWPQRLTLVAGVTYDHIHYPANHRFPPISDDHETRDQVSPKAGVILTPGKNTTLRAAYTRSLGGLSLDQSFRLEPTQVAGFVQDYRSLAPESVVSSVSAPSYETAGVLLDHRFPTRTYVAVGADWLQSDAAQESGTYSMRYVRGSNVVADVTPTVRVSDQAFWERGISASVNQLLGDYWALGMRYRLSQSQLDLESDQGSSEPEALLHALDGYVLMNLPCGFFTEFRARWRSQSNQGYDPDQPGDTFAQFDAVAGYRFLRRRCEVRLGVLNLTDEDYQLNPLSYERARPRERMLYAALKLDF